MTLPSGLDPSPWHPTAWVFLFWGIRILYVNTLRDKQGGTLLLKSPGQSLGKSLLFFAAVVVGQRRKRFCIRGHLKRQQLVVLADRGHVLSRAFRLSIQPTFQNTHHCHFNCLHFLTHENHFSRTAHGLNVYPNLPA